MMNIDSYSMNIDMEDESHIFEFLSLKFFEASILF
jgi:hypothetical protein